ncbi:TetR family transcriptional regulator [Actinomadura kijaniata]|uniref:AcrR family transcriptional regulator n=1 Tax=Actinomadura namibiensis TaxID=182080 RepID=A0A7W3QIH5_ACTNM|nr:TetR family transcriptional regulator [Actinomadura namibiensis]MBA8948464.1 AcrR family transcriptional regulator [Actinomadura namibiensis]
MSTSLPEQTSPPGDPLDRLPLRERKKLRTRRAIQEHALRLFLDQGYDATTVEQVAAAAEVSPSTVFRYFPTKEDLVVTDEYDPVMTEFFRSQPADLTPLEALRATFRQVFPYLDAQDRATMVARTRMMLEVPALRARMIDSMRSGTLGVVAELVGERTGRAPDDRRVQAFAWAVMGVLQAAMYAWLDSDATLDLAALVDANLEFLAEGLPL